MMMSSCNHSLARDSHRPRYHFLPPANWMNDPNGLIHWQGRYHLFYQYNPNGPFHGTIHWGHAVSDDLVHWEHLPIALAPGDLDADGCWSGCAVDADGTPLLFYTGVSPQRQLLATGSPDLLHWRKHPEPLIAAPPPDIDAGPHQDFRDPYVWRAEDGWYMVIGSQDVGKGGVILLYRSMDLRRWDYLHPLLRAEEVRGFPIWNGSMWECPNFFPLGDAHVLMLSVWDQQQTYYPVVFSGDFSAQKFHPRRQERVDWGGCFYAPQVMRDAHGRALMWGWLWEQRTAEAQRAAGWAGVMSLPRVLSLAPDGALLQQPARQALGRGGSGPRRSDGRAGDGARRAAGSVGGIGAALCGRNRPGCVRCARWEGVHPHRLRCHPRIVHRGYHPRQPERGDIP